jgi:hypothetical protein
MPANSRHFFFACGGDSSFNGSSIGRSALPSPVGGFSIDCQVSDCLLVGVGSVLTSLYKCSFKIDSSAVFGAMYRFHSLNSSYLQRRSVIANGLYTKYCSVDMLYPNHMPGVALYSSFCHFSFGTWTEAKHPNTQRCFKDGFIPCQASDGVLPTTDRVAVGFLRWTATETAKPQYFFESSAWSRMHRMHSMIVRFARSTSPLDRGELEVVVPLLYTLIVGTLRISWRYTHRLHLYETASLSCPTTFL